MARTKIPGGYISNGAITSAHLHASHGITTSTIAEGTNEYFTDARVMTSMGSVNVHILPSANETYDLGSASLRWRDLFLSGDTINLGGTKLSKDSSGNLEIKDSSDNPKKIKVSEIEFNDGTNVRRLKISAGKIKSFDGSDGAVKLDLSSSTTSDIAEGTNKYYTDARADARITAADTGDLSEGSNLYFTNARARAAISATGSLSYNSTTGVMSFTMPAQNSDNITEGTSNLYFTNARADARIVNAGSANWNTAYGWGNHASAGYTDDQTAAEILTALKTVDVNGTAGVNAGTFDGLGSGSFLRSDVSDGSYRISQTGHGVPVNNLGSPSLSEMALHDEQFNNKTAFYPIANLKFYTSTDGTNWTEYTSFSDTNKRKFLGGDASSSIYIPNATAHFRIELINNGSYVYLNSLYMYWSSNSHNTTVKIRKQRGDGVWSQHTNSNATVGSWPGHLYLPFSTIAFHPSTTSTGHYRTVHFDFEPNWSTGSYSTNNINLYKFQVWGGYPAGKRNIHSIDENKNVTFPEVLAATGGNSTNWNTAYGWGNHASATYATQSYVGTAISNLVDSSPAALNTLNELAAAIGDDASFSTTVTNNIAAKLPLAGGTITGGITSTATGNAITISSEAPQIRLNDTTSGADDFWIHVNSNIFYILGDRDDSGAWETPHPLALNSSNNVGTVFGSRLFTETYHPNADTLTTARTINGVSFNGSANITVADSTKLPLSGGTLTGTLNISATTNARDTKISAGYHLQRSDHHSGHLEGSYNNIGGNGAKTNPIYTIGSSYNPASTTLGNMYGIGYTDGAASFISGTGFAGWGMYVAADGDARVYLSGANGTVASTGQHYVGSSVVWNAGNDGAGSGLDADLLDGYNASSGATGSTIVLRNGSGHIYGAYILGSYFNASSGNSENPAIGQIWTQSGADNYLRKSTPAHFRTHLGLWWSGNDGSGSGLDADTVDGIQGASLLRSDADDSFSGGLVSTVRDEGIFGVYDPYKTDHIWSMGTAYKNHASGTNFGSLYGLAYKHTNNATGGTMGGGHQMVWCNAGTPRAAMGYDRFWHAASGNLWGSSNDGSGSGLDADLLDGANSDTAANANTIVKRDGDGYIHGVYFNSAIGISEALSLDITKIYVSNDNYIRTMGKSDFKVRMGLTKSDYDRMDFSSNTRYHTGSNSHNDITFNQLWSRGSGFIDNWNTGAGKPPSGTHFNGFQALHYTDGGSYNHGMQMAMSAGNPSLTYLRGHWANGGTGTAWQKIWTDGNDGSGSGLDADTVRGSVPSFTDTNTTYNFSGPTFTSRNSGNPIAIDSVTSNMVGYVNTSTAAGFSDGAGFSAAYSSSWVGQLFVDFRTGKLSTRGKNNGTWQAHRFMWDNLNDGSGSGLDADLLDGYQLNTGRSSIANRVVATDANGYIQAGWINTTSGATTGTSRIYASNDGYIRYVTNDTFRNNLGLWWTGNDGSGSGLDADTVDGIQGASFLRGDTGDTIADNIVLTQRGRFSTGTSGQNTNSGSYAYDWGFQNAGGWTSPYPDLIIGYHTGLRMGAHKNYQGTRFYNDAPKHGNPTMIFSVGNGDDHIRATSNIYAYTSDRRLKENFRPIENAVDKVKSLGGYIFDWRKDMMAKYEFEPDQVKDDAGVIAQDVLKVLPAAVQRAPFDYDAFQPGQSKSGEEFMTVQYEKIVPLLIQAIKEQQEQIDELKQKLEN